MVCGDQSYCQLVLIGSFDLGLGTVSAQRTTQTRAGLDSVIASKWGDLVLKGIDTEFPNKLSLMYSNEKQISRPRNHFPAFYGCFDWHSSVHGHWLLVRLLKNYPDIVNASQIRDALRLHFNSPESEQGS